MKRGLLEMSTLRPIYTTERHTNKRYGFADMAGIQTYVDMFREEGVIARSIPAAEVVTNEFIEQINDFDLAKVRALAQNWK